MCLNYTHNQTDWQNFYWLQWLITVSRHGIHRRICKLQTSVTTIYKSGGVWGCKGRDSSEAQFLSALTAHTHTHFLLACYLPTRFCIYRTQPLLVKHRRTQMIKRQWRTSPPWILPSKRIPLTPQGAWQHMRAHIRTNNNRQLWRHKHLCAHQQQAGRTPLRHPSL